MNDAWKFGMHLLTTVDERGYGRRERVAELLEKAVKVLKEEVECCELVISKRSN